MEVRRRSRWNFGALALGAVLPLMAALPAWAAMLPETVTPTAVQVRGLYNIVFFITTAIMILVAGLLIFVMVKFRQRPGENRQPASFTHNTTLELIWTVVPAIILVSIAFPTYKTMVFAETEPEDPDAVHIDVIGHQWYWEYKYPLDKVGMSATDGTKTPIVVPVNRTVRMNLTSADVIHSWFVAPLGFKIDTTPGRVTHAWFKIEKAGTYKGQCAELCGTRHANMAITVKAVPQAQYDTWLKQQDPIEEPAAEQAGGDKVAAVDPAAAKDELLKKGKKAYETRCATCHGAEGAGTPGSIPPLAGAEQVNGKPEDHIKIVLNGLTGAVKVKGGSYNGVMPAWKDVLNDKEIAAILTYERNSWGNNAGVVTPDQVKALR